MASRQARNIIKNFLDTNYFSFQYYDLTGVIDSDDLPKRSDFLALIFGTATETRTSLNNCYQENGTFQLVCMRQANISADQNVENLLDMVEELRDLFRGKRIGEIVIFQTDPADFNVNAEFQISGFVSATINITYEFRFSFP